MNIFYRENKMFKINTSALSEKAKKTEIINALYAAVYEEFKGAITNFKYKDLTPLEKMNKLNQFAKDWLRKRGL